MIFTARRRGALCRGGSEAAVVEAGGGAAGHERGARAAVDALVSVLDIVVGGDPDAAGAVGGDLKPGAGVVVGVLEGVEFLPSACNPGWIGCVRQAQN